MTFINGGVTAPAGFKASGVHAGFRKNQRKKDLALIYSENVCSSAAVYTQNVVKGAPIAVTKRHIADGLLKATICNSGNANTCNADGEQKAMDTCEALAASLGIKPDECAVASTGTIGVPLDIDCMKAAIPELVKGLSDKNGTVAAEAIMTTDAMKKECAVEIELDGKVVTIGGMCKGSGMIHPNMATMLAFITTDAAISVDMLKHALKEAVDKSFNLISVDGDTSTNDMALIMANGASGMAEISSHGAAYEAFVSALTELSIYLAKKMARDGEGATKMIECVISNAQTEHEAQVLAKSVIGSNLVKSAMFGMDANWGRILCALGYSGIEFDPTNVDVCFRSVNGEILVCRDGSSVGFDEDKALEILKPEEITIAVDMKRGGATGYAWGCDLTYDYVKINGSYRT